MIFESAFINFSLNVGDIGRRMALDSRMEGWEGELGDVILFFQDELSTLLFIQDFLVS